MNRYQSIKTELSALVTEHPLAFYIGWTDDQNLGDKALREVIPILFRDHLFVYNKPYLGKGLRWKFKKHRNFDCIMLGGGTLIIRDQNYLKRLHQYQTKKKIIFGTGVADPAFWGDYLKILPPDSVQRWVDWINADCDYIGVRGPLSRQILLDHGVAKEIRVTGDPALYLCRDTLSPKTPQKKTIGVNLGHSKNIVWGKSDEVFLNKMEEILRVLLQQGWQLVFMPVWDKDMPWNQLLMHRLANGKSSPRLLVCRDAHSYIQAMDQVDLFLGEKLHSVIFAACSYTPVIMLEYRPKCRDFMKSLDLESFTVRIHEVTTEAILALVDKCWQERSAIQKHLFAKCQFYKQTLLDEAKSAATVVGAD